MTNNSTQIARAAASWLMAGHNGRNTFTPLAGELVPASMAAAYDVQDALVAMRNVAWNTQRAGHKIALTTPQMRKFVGYEDSIAGQVLAKWKSTNGVLPSPARVSLADYGHLLFECELAFLMGQDLPLKAAPPTRDEVAQCIEAVCPAFELADDRHADYTQFGKDGGATLLTLAADNAWNSGVVLGEWRRDWRDVDLAALTGVATINGEKVGEGAGRDVMGHPLDAMHWIASHLHARGTTLRHGEFVITGSLITSKFPKTGDLVRFDVAGLGSVSLDIASPESSSSHLAGNVFPSLTRRPLMPTERHLLPRLHLNQCFELTPYLG